MQEKVLMNECLIGSHPFLGGEIARKTNAKRVADGTHHWLGPESNMKRVADGTHNLIGPEHNQKRLENGTHPSQIKKTCPHCGKTYSSNNYARWHGDRCKSLFEEHV